MPLNRELQFYSSFGRFHMFGSSSVRTEATFFSNPGMFGGHPLWSRGNTPYYVCNMACVTITIVGSMPTADGCPGPYRNEIEGEVAHSVGDRETSICGKLKTQPGGGWDKMG